MILASKFSQNLGGPDKKQFSLKYTHNDQCSRLQQRYQNEAQLFEDLRFFMKQRCLIEKAYGQSLVKLSQNYLAKLSQSLLSKRHKKPSGENEDVLLTDAWKNYLQKTEEIGKVRTQNSEVYISEVSEACKLLRNHRTQTAKLVFEYVAELQKEVMQSTQDAQKLHKVYKEKFQKTQECSFKLKSVAQRMKTSTPSNKLQQQHNQLTEEMQSYEAKSDTARNNYILDLVSSNSHLRQYYTSDLPEFVKLVDGEFYEDWKRFLSLAADTEIKSCHESVRCCENTNFVTQKVTRDYDVFCFFIDNPCLTEVVEHPFVPHNGDETSKVVKTPATEIDLEKEARRHSVQAARETKVAAKCQGELDKIHLENLEVEERTKQFEAYFNLKRVIQQSKAKKAKSLSRMEALRDGGVNVDVWVDEVNMRLSIGKDEDCDSFDSRHDGQADDAHSVSASYQDDKNASDRGSTIYPYWCSALYDYEAVNQDELTFRADERLKIVGDGSGDGWIWAENVSGTMGLVPQNYFSASDETQASDPSIHSGQIEVLRSAPPPPNKQDSSKLVGEVQTPLPPLHQQIVSQLSTNDNSSNIYAEVKKPESRSIQESRDVRWVRALYEYSGTCDEELSFSEGQLIKVTGTLRDIDDGWWEGEIKGQTGIFPSMMVEELFVVAPTQGVTEIKKTDGGLTNWKSSINLSVSNNISKEPDVVSTNNSTTEERDSSNINNSNNNSYAERSYATLKNRATAYESLTYSSINNNNNNNTPYQPNRENNRKTLAVVEPQTATDESRLNILSENSENSNLPSFEDYFKSRLREKIKSTTQAKNSNNYQSRKDTSDSPKVAGYPMAAGLISPSSVGEEKRSSNDYYSQVAKENSSKISVMRSPDSQVTSFSTFVPEKNPVELDRGGIKIYSKLDDATNKRKPVPSYYATLSNRSNQMELFNTQTPQFTQQQRSPQTYTITQQQKQDYDCSTLPRLNKHQHVIGRNPTGSALGTLVKDMTDSGIQIKSSYLGVGHPLSVTTKMEDYPRYSDNSRSDYMPNYQSPVDGRGSSGYTGMPDREMIKHTSPIHNVKHYDENASSNNPTTNSTWVAHESRESYI